MIRLHKHLVDNRLCITKGEGYDCPPERACWFLVPEESAEQLLLLWAPPPDPPDAWHPKDDA